MLVAAIVNNLRSVYWRCACLFLFIIYFFIWNAYISFADNVSFEQCDRELMRHCSGSIYNTSERKQQCVKTKQKYFSVACLSLLLGEKEGSGSINRVSQGEHAEQDQSIHTEDFDDDNNVLIVDNIEATVDESRTSHKIVNPVQSALVNEERAENNHKVVMPVTNTEIATSLTLTTYCWADVLRFCKTTNRHKQVVLKDNADVCLTKIIKHKKRLTMQCRNMLQYGYIKSNAKTKTRNG